MGNNSVINKENIIGLIQRTLNEVDRRLVEHGQRMAFLVSGMLDEKGGFSDHEKQNICILALLHDIGAYKTEEIDRMVEFEANDVWEHPVYGYIFLDTFSPLKGWAETILYHHLSADKLPVMDEQIRCATQMINLADRMEILSRSYAEINKIDLLEREAFSYLDTMSDSLFDREIVECFKRAEKRGALFERLLRDDFGPEEFFSKVILTDEECIQYVNMLTYVIDFRSQHTVTHTITTTSISCSTARHMGVSEEQIERIRYGAMMHDLGKIGVPVEILEFPGKLSTQAMRIMRTHVEITERILGGSVAEDVTNLALRHHEKIDGSGYPIGLKGEELTLEEQIVAVSDVVSALLGTRSYKDAYSSERTLKIIQNMADEGKLNSEIVEVIHKHFDEILAEVNENCTPALENYHGMQSEYLRLLEELSKCSSAVSR